MYMLQSRLDSTSYPIWEITKINSASNLKLFLKQLYYSPPAPLADGLIEDAGT